MKDITIKRVPSWDKCSGLLGEFNRHLRGSDILTTERLFTIAAELRSVEHATRMGAPMPKDWKKVHPSLKYQMAQFAERIEDIESVRGCNNPPTIWIEILPKDRIAA
jgi:hypothetical protein